MKNSARSPSLMEYSDHGHITLRIRLRKCRSASYHPNLSQIETLEPWNLGNLSGCAFAGLFIGSPIIDGRLHVACG